MIRIEHLVKTYGVLRAVDGLSLEVREGECVGLVGPNGAGKSTTLKSIVGLVRPTAGRITVAGHDAARAPHAARAALGYLPQGVQFAPGFTAAETATLFARVRGLAGAPARAREALDRVGLAAAADRDVAGFSGGMRQRLGLAVALLGAPATLVLDEPTVSLDPEASMAIRDVLAAERAAGRTVLISSHILAELEAVVDRVAVVQEGRLLAEGRPADLARRLGLAARLRIDAGADAPRAAEAARAAGAADVRVEGACVEFRVADGRKLAVLDAVRAATPVRDVTIEPVRLEDVYRRLLSEASRSEGASHAA
ncbi:MAG TPA: ABC transporter ATP-binding protein [Thermodesulfobacteriota bacterium]